MKTRDQSELVNIGRINSAVGLGGEVRVTLYSSDSVNLKEGKNLLLKRAKDTVETVCEKVRMQNKQPIAKFSEIDDRNAAEFLKGMEIYITEDQLEELPEGEHYVRDIVGYKIYDISKKAYIGTLQDVIQNTAQSVLDVKTDEGKQILIPVVDAFMREINDDTETINVELIPGFLD